MALPQGDVLPEHGDGDGVDRISDLPEELLLKVLAGLGSAREAARTGVLSGRWRGLWTRLSEYTFSEVEPEAVEAALAQVTLPAFDRLDIDVLLKSWTTIDRAASLLHGAARISIESVSVSLQYPMWEEDGVPGIELPCFDRTRSLILDKEYCVPFAPPTAGEFSRLESLELTTGCNIFAALLPNCPRMRVLRIHGCRVLEVTVHSSTIEELAVECTLCFESSIRRIDAPELKEANLEVNMKRGFDVPFLAPKVEKHSWKFTNLDGNVDGFRMRCMLGCSLKYGVRTLRLEVDCLFQFGSRYPERSLAQAMACLPVADFSVLEVVVHTQGHTFGSLLLHLLQLPPAIQKLDVYIEQLEYEEWCPKEDCPCRQLIDWKNETISLSDLKEVHISYLPAKGDEEVDFLKLLFRCTPGLKHMNVAVGDKLHEEIRSICGENPHVKCDLRSCSW